MCRVFGRVVGGLEVITAMERVPVGADDRPQTEIKITGDGLKGWGFCIVIVPLTLVVDLYQIIKRGLTKIKVPGKGSATGMNRRLQVYASFTRQQAGLRLQVSTVRWLLHFTLPFGRLRVTRPEKWGLFCMKSGDFVALLLTKPGPSHCTQCARHKPSSV